MFRGIATINILTQTGDTITKDFDLRPNFTETRHKDIDLDDFVGVIRGLTLDDIKTYFEDGNFVDVTIDEIDSIDTVLNTEKKRWIITTCPSRLINRNTQTYELDLTCVEYTRKLQNDIVIGKSFKQPNILDDTDPTTWRYKAIDVLRRMLNDSSLYEGVTTFSELDDIIAANVISAFPYAIVEGSLYNYNNNAYRATDTLTVNNETEFFNNADDVRDNTEFYMVVDTSLFNLLDIRSADFAWRDKTLFEVIVDIFTQIDAAPRLEYDYSYNKDVIKADLYNRKGNVANKNTDVFKDDRKFNALDNLTHQVTRFENVTDSSVNNVSFYPSISEYVSLRSEGNYINKAGNLYIPTGGRPIADLLDVRIDLRTIPGNPTFTFKTTTGTINVALSSILATATYSGDTVHAPASFISHIVESKEYEILKTKDGDIYKSKKKFDANTLEFTRFSPNIKIKPFDDRGLWRTDTETLWNSIGSGLINDDNFYNAIKQLDSSALQEVTNVTGIPNTDLEYSQLGFQVKFISSNDIIVNVEKLNDFRYADNPNRIFKKYINQQDRNIDIEKASWFTLSSVERAGLPDININKTHNSMTDRHDISDYDGKDIITIASHTYGSKLIKSRYQFNTNFNKTSTRLPVDSNVRTANISREDEVDVLKFLKAYIEIDSDLPNNFNTTDGEILSINDKFLDEFFNTDTTPNQLAFIYQAVRTGIDWDGTEKYTNLATQDLDNLHQTDGIGSTTFLTPTDVRVIGRTLLITTKFRSKTSAGYRIIDNTSSEFQERDQVPIPYVYLGDDALYQGEFERAHGTIGYGTNIDIDPRQIPYLISTDTITDNTIGFFQDQGVEKDERILIKNAPIFKDRDENIIQQVELEIKSRNTGLVVYPEFLRSHKITGKVVLPKVAILKDTAPNITLGIRNLSQIDSNDILSSGGTVTYTKDGSNRPYIEVTNGDNLKKYIIYNNINGYNEIMLVNNQPTQLSSDNTKSRLYLRLRSTLLDVLEQPLFDNFYASSTDTIKIYSQADSWNIGYDTFRLSDPNIIGNHTFTGDKSTIENAPVFKAAGLYKFQFDMEYVMNEANNDYGIDPNITDEGVLQEFDDLPLGSNTDIHVYDMQNLDHINIKEGMVHINGGLQLLQPDQEYTVSANVKALMQTGTGTGTPDESGDFNYLENDPNGNDIQWFASVGTSDDIGHMRFFTDLPDTDFDLTLDNDMFVFTDLRTPPTPDYFTSIEFLKSGTLTGTVIFESFIGGIDGKAGYVFNNTSASRGDLDWISSNMSSKGDTRTITISREVTAGDTLTFYATDNNQFRLDSVFIGVTQLDLNLFIDLDDDPRNVEVLLIRAPSDYSGGTNYSPIDNVTYNSAGAKDTTLSGTIPADVIVSYDTLYVIAQNDPIATVIPNQTITEATITATSPYRIDKRVFYSLESEDGTLQLLSGEVEKELFIIDQAFEHTLDAGDLNKDIVLKILPGSGTNPTLDLTADDKLTITSLDLDINRFTE